MGMRRMGPPPISLARVPVKILAKLLDLTPDQKTKIADIQKNLPQRRPMGGPGFGGPNGGPNGGPGGPPPEGGPGGPPNGGPPDGGPGGGGPGGPPPGGGPGFGGPGPGGPGGPMGMPSPAEQKAIKQIKEILTDEQNERVPKVMEDIRGIGPAGLPMPVLEKIDLSKDQWSKIHAILVKNRPSQDQQGEPGAGRPNFREIHDQIFALLTDDQKKIASEFRPRGPMGGPGFGGPGGPPPGGPDGGPGGPPPGDGDGQ